jgi:hypothetical protein
VKRCAAFVLSLAIFGVPTLALADFHGPSDQGRYGVEAPSTQQSIAADKETVLAEGGFDLWIRSENSIG